MRGARLALGALALALGLLGCTHGAPVLQTAPTGLSYRVFEPPPGVGKAPFPVVVFLHDYFGDSGILWRKGVIAEIERRMRAGTLPPFLLVAPEGGHGWWADAYDRRRLYETWIVDDLRRAIVARYPVRDTAAGWAVGGISMGGQGAVRLALRVPGRFAAAGALSGALMHLDWEFVRTARWPTGSSLRKAFGTTATANSAEANDVWRLLAAWPPDAPKPRLVLRAGQEDKYKLDGAAHEFAVKARLSRFDAALITEPGVHDWSYWRRVAPDWLGDLVRALPADAAAALPSSKP